MRSFGRVSPALQFLAWWQRAWLPWSHHVSHRRPTHIRSGSPCIGSVGAGARVAGLLAPDRLYAGKAKEVPSQRPRVQRVPGTGFRGNLPLQPAFCVRRHLSLGSGAAAAALFGFWQFKIRPTFRGEVRFFASRWPTSRWLASERTANWGAQQLYLIVAGALLGPAALGGLKAAQALVSGPTNVVLNGSGSFGLPEASRHFAERGWVGMARVTRIVTGAVVPGCSRMWRRRPDIRTNAHQIALRPRVRGVRRLCTDLRCLRHDLRIFHAADSQPDHHTSGSTALHAAAGKVGVLGVCRLCVGLRFWGDRRCSSRSADIGRHAGGNAVTAVSGSANVS